MRHCLRPLFILLLCALPAAAPLLGKDKEPVGPNAWVWTEGETKTVQTQFRVLYRNYQNGSYSTFRDWELKFQLDITCDKLGKDGPACTAVMTIDTCIIRNDTTTLVEYDKSRFDPADKNPDPNHAAMHAISGTPFKMQLTPHGSLRACAGVEAIYGRTLSKASKKDKGGMVLLNDGKELLSSTTFTELLGLLMEPFAHDFNQGWQQPLALKNKWAVYPYTQFPLAYEAGRESGEERARKFSVDAVIITDEKYIEIKPKGKFPALPPKAELEGGASLVCDPDTKAAWSHEIRVKHHLDDQNGGIGSNQLNSFTEGQYVFIMEFPR